MSGRARRISAPRGGSAGRPARRRDGAIRAARSRPASPDRGCAPAARASSSWSGGQSGSGVWSSPVITGLSALTCVPRARSAARIAAASTRLTDAGVGAGDEQAPHRRRLCGPLFRSLEVEHARARWRRRVVGGSGASVGVGTWCSGGLRRALGGSAPRRAGRRTCLRFVAGGAGGLAEDLGGGSQLLLAGGRPSPPAAAARSSAGTVGGRIA